MTPNTSHPTAKSEPSLPAHAHPPAAKPCVAYVVAEFPSLSETFILREILALQESGVRIEIFALRRPTPGPMHNRATELQPGVHYRRPLLDPRHALAKLFWFRRAPGRYYRAVAGAFTSAGGGLGGVFRGARRFLTAVDFAREAQRRGVTRVHAHFAFVTADVGRLMAGLLDVPLTVSAHAWDIYTQTGPALARRLLPAEAVITCTAAGRKALLTKCPALRPGRVSVHHHGLQPSTIEPGQSDGRTVLGVGRLEAKKGFCYLIDACDILRRRGVDLSCRIVGDGALRAPLERMAGALGLDNTVALAGAMEHGRLLALYRTAAVVVLPSVVTANGDRDGLANVLLEAMAAAVPVISTTDSAAAEAISDGVEGFIVPPHDPEAIAQRLEELLRNPQRRNEMGRAARQRICQDFTITRNVAPLAEMWG